MHLVPVSQTTQGRVPQSGFSLVELVITIAIVVLVTGMVMVKYSSFNNLILLKSQAYEIALDIRQAQLYSVSSKVDSSGAARIPYGIYLHKDTNTYYLFQDTDSSGGDAYIFNGDGSGGASNDKYVGEPYPIDPRFEIKSLCTYISTGSNCNRRQLSITFKRPDFDAYFGASNNADPNLLQRNATFTRTEIVLQPINGTQERKIVVYPSGQITVE